MPAFTELVASFDIRNVCQEWLTKNVTVFSPAEYQQAQSNITQLLLISRNTEYQSQAAAEYFLYLFLCQITGTSTEQIDTDHALEAQKFILDNIHLLPFGELMNQLCTTYSAEDTGA